MRRGPLQVPVGFRRRQKAGGAATPRRPRLRDPIRALPQTCRTGTATWWKVFRFRLTRVASFLV